VTITDEIRMKPEISNKIWFILNMHKIIKYNNKLQDRNVPLLEMNTPEYVIPGDCLLLQTASINHWHWLLFTEETYHQKNDIVTTSTYQYNGIQIDKDSWQATERWSCRHNSLSAAEIYSINSNWSWWSMEASLLFTTYKAHWCACKL